MADESKESSEASAASSAQPQGESGLTILLKIALLIAVPAAFFALLTMFV